MAGVYGAINSRADFLRILGEAIESVRNFLARTPNDWAMLRIEKEIAAMQQWSNGGREPTEDERSSIDIGLIAVRELEGVLGVDRDFLEKLHALNNYFEDWPTDLEAASATDDDFFETP